MYTDTITLGGVRNMRGAAHWMAVGSLLLAVAGCANDAMSANDDRMFADNQAGSDVAGTTATGGVAATGGMSGGLAGNLAGSFATGGIAGQTGGSLEDPQVDSGTGGDLLGMGATMSGTGGMDTTIPDDAPPCLTKGSQVALIGDSYINWASHTFPADLNSEAGQTFRMYAVGGYSMGSGGIGLIPPEFDQAVAADPDIIAVVLDGGGNDVLIPSATYPNGGQCKNSVDSPNIADCQTIISIAIDAASTLLDTMASKGVHDVVYFFYPHVPEGTVLGGTAPNSILDYAFPMVKDFCDGAKARTGGKTTCHFVDLIPVFEGHPDWFAPTDIHPNSTGSAAMAQAVWQKMKDECIAQPASSGCCKP